MNKAAFRAWCARPKPVVSLPHYRGRPLIMGILNLTPDSFSDGGLFLSQGSALRQAEKMVSEGADILDIGAESTRPGATPLSVDEELERLMPILERIIKHHDVAVSVDTYKPEVMQAVADAGAACINDVFALQKPGALEVAAGLDVPICLMHMQGTPETMQVGLHETNDMMMRIQDFFGARIKAAENAGIARERLILDPGFGFGKTPRQNLQMVKALSQFHTHDLPLLLGVSRKSTIGAVLKQTVDKRLSGGLALSVFSACEGLSMIRTHDVQETREALDIIDVMLQDSDLD